MKRHGTGTEARILARAQQRALVRAEAEAATALEQEDIEPIPETSAEAADASYETTLTAADAAAGTRLDQFLVAHLAGISRARAQMLLAQQKITLRTAQGDAVEAAKLKPNFRVSAGDFIQVLGAPQPAPLRAVAEDIPLDIVYEDRDIAVINKSAGMTVHAGAGAEPDDERGRGTLVNALLHHFSSLAKADDTVRPGIVHRLDKQTSGLIVIAKNDAAHTALAAAFAERHIEKHYIALVHGEMSGDRGTVNVPIARDAVRRTRMTTRGRDGRNAVTHWKVKERLSTPWGDFTLLDIRIETGRTHQIRVHLSSIGHPVVGDTLYGAPAQIVARELKNQPVKSQRRQAGRYAAPLKLHRNFLHAASLSLPHPRSGKEIQFSAPLPPELGKFVSDLHAS